ncbi:hypothetical protein [Lapillicoccus sp.]|uniref:hypothetical protein n=1 Tax=Lapillicoccus sp. TaxID=1909287 RepID=UPI0032663177
MLRTVDPDLTGVARVGRCEGERLLEGGACAVVVLREDAGVTTGERRLVRLDDVEETQSCGSRLHAGDVARGVCLARLVPERHHKGELGCDQGQQEHDGQ